jgi:hypothetical protein
MAEGLPRYSLRVVESGEPVRYGRAHVVRIQHEIRVSADLLEEYCFAKPTSVGYDLMTVAGAIKYADRAFTRHHAQSWSRSIKLQIPVLDKATWQKPNVADCLRDCLTYLTGDDWQFSFTQRRKEPPEPTRLIGLHHAKEHIFIPYSHGLDSFAQLRLLESREADTVPVCVFTSNTGRDKTWKALCREKTCGGVKPIPVPIQLPKIPHSEPSFRTRPFIYYSMTAYGALLAKSGRVIVPENGQGSLGGSLVTMGYECGHRSCHPGFTHRLSRFLRELTGEPIAFEHPELFRTKGQVVTDLVAKCPDSDQWLLEHWSCSHDQRNSSVDHKQLHCGVCGNCLLRRVSIKAAALDDPTSYMFEDLAAFSIEESSRHRIRAIRSFTDLAGNGVRSMQRLADLAQTPQHSGIWTEVAAISQAMGIAAPVVHLNLMQMLECHRREWNAFLAPCGEHSWISRIARE